MPKYRVTEISEIEAGSPEEALSKVASNLDGEVVSQDIEPLGRSEGEPGCPACGGTIISVMAMAMANVFLEGVEHGHVDEIEWGESHDVDLIEARSFTCNTCGHHQDVDGDSGLYDALALKWY